MTSQLISSLILAMITGSHMIKGDNVKPEVTETRRPAPTRVHCRLREELPRGTFVADVRSAIDHLLLPVRKNTTFAFLSHQPRELFTLDRHSGVLTTAEVIDRESICRHLVTCTVELRIGVIVETGSARHFRLVIVVVDIIDKNDNRPTFVSGRIEISLSEATKPGLLFPLPVANDPDSPAHANIRYRMTSVTSMFELQSSKLDGETGGNLVPGPPTLILREFLDRERQDRYQLRIVANDISGGSEPSEKTSGSNSLVVDVTVIDANDNGPTFENSLYSTTVSRYAPVGSPLLRVRALDPDLADNGLVRYLILNSSCKSKTRISPLPFQIDHTTGQLVVSGSLQLVPDRDSFSFCVRAYDPSAPEAIVASATAQVLVELDESPAIRLHTDSEWVGHRLNDTWWRLERKTTSDDTITSPEMMFGVEQLLANITVLNRKYVSECQLSADNHVGCFRLDKHDEEFFRIYMTSSTIQPEVSCKTYEWIRLSIDCSVTGNTFEEKLATVTVDVRHPDVTPILFTGNSNASCSGEDLVAFYRKSFSFDVAENLPPATTISKITRKGHRPGCFRFHLGPEVELFKLDGVDGTLSTLVPLDREDMEFYTFLIYADPSTSVSGGVQTANVTVRVTDINDNSPVVHWSPPFYFVENYTTINVRATLGVGDLVASVTVTDADEGINSLLTYELSYVDTSLATEEIQFNIDNHNGSIFLLSSLANVTDGSQLRLSMIVRDSGTPSLNTSCVIVVIVSNNVTSLKETASLRITSSASVESQRVLVAGVVGGLIAVGAVVILVAVVLVAVKRRKRPMKVGYSNDVLNEKLDFQPPDGDTSPPSTTTPGEIESNYITNMKTSGDSFHCNAPSKDSAVEKLHSLPPSVDARLDSHDSHQMAVPAAESQTSHLDVTSSELSAISLSRRGQLNDWLSSEGYQLRITGNAYQVKRHESVKPVTRRCYNVPTRTFSDSDQTTRTGRCTITDSTYVNTATDV